MFLSEMVAAAEEARRFLKAYEAIDQGKLEFYGGTDEIVSWNRSMGLAALRRASLDLSRALSVMRRRNGGWQMMPLMISMLIAGAVTSTTAWLTLGEPPATPRGQWVGLVGLFLAVTLLMYVGLT